MNTDTLQHVTTMPDNNNDNNNNNSNNIDTYNTIQPSSKSTIHTSNIPQNNELLSREMKRETELVTEEEINIVVKKKSSKLIRKEDFVIPTYKTRKDLLEKKYTLPQLKTILKNYGLRISGNKKQLIERCYTYLVESEQATKIQRLYKGHLLHRYMRLRGPALLKKHRSLCVNDCDFLTMDALIELPHWQFYSFEENGHIYGFDICSLYNLIIKIQADEKGDIRNPYTRTIFKKGFIKTFRKAIHLSNLVGYKPQLEIENATIDMNETQKLRMRVETIFQEMDRLGNYTNSEWFLQLDRRKLVRFIRELFDIWNYRIDIHRDTRIKIVPPHGNPFVNCNIQTIHIRDYESIFPDIVRIMESFVLTGVDDTSKSLGCIYCLGALTIVCSEAAEALPWLYETFHHNALT